MLAAGSFKIGLGSAIGLGKLTLVGRLNSGISTYALASSAVTFADNSFIALTNTGTNLSYLRP